MLCQVARQKTVLQAIDQPRNRSGVSEVSKCDRQVRRFSSLLRGRELAQDGVGGDFAKPTQCNSSAAANCARGMALPRVVDEIVQSMDPVYANSIDQIPGSIGIR